MNIIRNTNISKKLIAVFSVIILLMFSLTIFNTYNMKVSNDELLRSSDGLGGTTPENTAYKFSTLVVHITSSNLFIPER